ncbi:MAG TPA: ABC transporter permease [Longimicrobium sp.]|jgi:ribose/xylose/arabinose/galactoside ABC-type transport system permease subunit|uniref:ABC transporter permease n=1 Tax=Longimicrobium sp. TaxID=2029185 RepID=UPI002ED8E608
MTQATAAVRPAAGAGSMGRWWGAMGATGGAVVALVVLVLANAVFTPNFATTSNFWNILFQLSVTLLVAVGMTLVIATGGIDLSVGSVMAISAAVAAVTVDQGLMVAIPLALLAGCAVGLLNGAFVSYFKVQAIVVTLATLLAGRGLAQIINRDGALITINDPGFLVLGRGHVGPVPVQVLIAAAVVALAVFVLRSTPFGRYVLAAGGNPAAARLAGVPVTRTVITVYVMSGALAALAGLVEASRLGASAAARIGQGAELDAIAAVVVGGTLLSGGRATLLGTVVGALIMQVIATSFNMLLIPYAWALAFKALIILFAVYLQLPRRV